MMLLCGRSISQTATQINKAPQEQNKVVIDTSMARKIATDLVKGDVCRAEIKLVKDNFKLTQEEVVKKDSIIKTMQEQKVKLNLIIDKKDEMFVKQEEISNTYRKALSKQKATTFIYKALSLLGVISTTLLIIK